MIDRPDIGLSNTADDQRLRYIRRSSVYSRRTLDGIVQSSTSKPVIHNAPSTQPAVALAHNKVSQPARRPPGPKSLDILPARQTTKVPSIPRQQFRQAAPPRVDEPVLVEQMVSFKQRLLSKNTALISMAAFVFLFGLGVSINSLMTNKHVTQQVQALSSDDKSKGDDGGTSGDQKPDETPLHPSAVNSYQVAPELPRKITIQKLGVAARIKPLGVSRENQLLAPTSIFDAGWYNASAKPGVDAGAVLIDGHVHGPTKPGIFVNLKKLVAGDIIEIERGDGRTVKYRVEKTSQEPADTLNMAALMTSIKPGKQGLNLVTCGGKLDTKTGHYESRDEVFAVQVD